MRMHQVEVLPALEEGLLMLTLERTAMLGAEEREQGDEDMDEERTDVFPADVIELLPPEAAAALDAKFGDAGAWQARCDRARQERRAIAQRLAAAPSEMTVRVRPHKAGESLYATPRNVRLSVRLADADGVLLSVANEVAGYDDRPFEVKVDGAVRLFAEGEIEAA